MKIIVTFEMLEFFSAIKGVEAAMEKRPFGAKQAS